MGRNDERRRTPYKLTMFDRHGPAAGDRVRAFSFGLMAFGFCIPMFAVASQKIGLGGWKALLFTFGLSAACGLITMMAGLLLAEAAGESWKFLMVSGASTPYQEQYSQQQALVMQGRVAEALEQYEGIIASEPESVDVRLKAADLYAGDGANPRRAAALFREVQRMPSATSGQDIYASNRLIDLLTGPLAEPRRALVELRRLVERYPNSAAAVHGRDAIASLKEQFAAEDAEQERRERP